MTTRLPNKRYIGDGVYAGHDGYQLILETQDGIRVTNRIGVDDNALEGIKRYLEYAREFYGTGQHRTGPGCEDCGAEIIGPLGQVLGEVYQLRMDETVQEVRLCSDCAGVVTQEFLEGLIQKRVGGDEE